MPLSAWRKWWRRPSPRSKKLNKKPNFRKCFLEILEDRTLLSSTYTVNLTTDTTFHYGQQSGQFSGDLRWCIEQADQNPGSTIQFDPTVFPSSTNTTIHLSQGELQIAASMTIAGPGAGTVTVSGTDGKGGGSRDFDVTTSVDFNGNPVIVTISGLTITDGNASPNYNSLAGNQGGDIINGGNLTLNSDVVTNGYSLGLVGGPNGRGGAIYNAEGQGNTKLLLDNTIVQNSLATGPHGYDFSNTSAYLTAPSGGGGGNGQGGGIFNDASATLIVTDGSQIINNTALGGNGGNGGFGFQPTGKSARGGNGGDGGNGGYGQGGGIYNAGGSVTLTGNNLTSILLSDNVAQGGDGGVGNHGSNGVAGVKGGVGGNGGDGGSGGFADGGGIYNTGTLSFPSQMTLTYVNFLGNQALGGKGNIGGVAMSGGNGMESKGVGGTGGRAGFGGAGGNGGYAQGGGIFTGFGALSVSNSQFGLDATGVSDQAIGGDGGQGNVSGKAGSSTGGTAKGVGLAGGPGSAGGAGGDAGFAKGGAVANLNFGGNVAFTNTSFISSLAKGGTGGAGSNAGIGNTGTVDDQAATKSAHNAGLGGSGQQGGVGGVGGDAVGGGIFNAVGNLNITTSTLLSNQALGGTGGAGGEGGIGGTGGGGTSKGSGGADGGHGGAGGVGGQGGNAEGGGFFNLVGSVTITNSSFTAISKGGIGNEVVSGTGGAGGLGGKGGQGGDGNKSRAGAGGNGGNGGAGGNAGLAEAGAGGNEGGNTSLTGDIFTSSLVKMSTGGAGGTAGTGGDGGNISGHAASIGGNGGNGGAGGNSGPGLGGGILVTASSLTISNSTFGGPVAVLGNQIVGGTGGSGGKGGAIGHAGHGFPNSYAIGISIAGNGGNGGLGAYVAGGALDVGNKALSVQITNSNFTFNAITSGSGGNGGQGNLFSLDGRSGGLNGAGGNAGLAQGGAVSLSASSAENATLSSVTIASNSASGGAGGNGAINYLGNITRPFLIAGWNGYGSNGGNGGSVQGVGLAAINYDLNITNNSSLDGGTGQGGMGGTGGTATLTEPWTFQGGAGGSGGYMLGGGVFFSNNTSGGLTFNFSGGSASGNTVNGGAGGNGGNAGGSGHSNIAGGSGGNGGAAQGGGIYILAGGNTVSTTPASVNTTSLSNLLLEGDVLVGGRGGVGGAGSDASGGIAGNADGGGVFNSSVNTTTPSSLTVTGSTLAGNEVTGGIGGDAGDGSSANGGAGGAGGNAGNADGGGLFDGAHTTATVINSTFGGGSTNSTTPNANANILTGNHGGRGGNAGTASGVNENDGGPGGNGGSLAGADVYSGGNVATFINDTIVDGQADSPGIGGVGGSAAGNGLGLNGSAGVNGSGMAGGYYAAAGTNQIGNSIIDLNSDVNGVVQTANNFAGLDSSSTKGNTPPNTQGAAGPTSYVETVNGAIAIYNKSTGASLVVDSLSDFWSTEGRASPTSTFANPTVLWDEQIQRFIVAEQDVDTTNHVSVFNIAVSTSANPATLTNADWSFFQVTTTENTSNGFAANYDAQNPGSLGWNHDALVFTLNMVNQSGSTDHVQIDSISASALVNGTLLSQGVNAFRNDLTGAANLAPTLMHDAQTGAPMWFVEEGGDNKSIKVVKMTNVLSTSPAFTTTPLQVNQYSQAVAPLQPDGTAITSNINSSIQKVAEQNNLLVAAQTVSDSTGNQDIIQWYVIDVSSGTPKVQQQGDVSGGAGVYDAFPSIDINPQNAIGMTFIQSGTAANQYMSMYVTGRLATMPAGVMAAPVLVQAGQATYSDSTGGNEGRLSALSIDSNGSFWAANEFANTEPGANWGTAIANFNVTPTLDVVGPITSLGNNILGGTAGATGGSTFSTKLKDKLNVTAAQLNLGPLMIDGGPTPTDALLNNSNGKGVSIAIDAGGNTLVTSKSNPWYNVFGSNPTDQRGPGFPRIDLTNKIVDVGAYEYNPPIITSLNPPSIAEQSGTFTLTITGTGFVPGATVSFNGNVLTPTTISPTQITVTILGPMPDEDAGSLPVFVSIPDGSGLAGDVINSKPVQFAINEGSTLTLTNPGAQNNNEGDIITAGKLVIRSSDPDTTFSENGLPPGLSIDPTTGVISGTIAPYAVTNGQASQTFNVIINGSDEGVVQGSSTFTWTVADTTPPVLTAPSTQNNNEGDKITGLTVSAVDADQGTFTATGLPPGLTIDANGVISGIIAPYAVTNGQASQTFKVTVTATDNGVASNAAQFQWIVADTTPPTLTSPGNLTNSEGDKVNLQIKVQDADSFTATGLPPGLSISASGLISGTINPYAVTNGNAFQTFNVTITATDNGYQSQPLNFTWTVYDKTPPSFVIGNVTNNEGDTINLATNPVDADPNSITATGLPSGLTIDPNTGVITGTLGAYAGGTYNVTLIASDGAGNVGKTPFTWTVNDTTPPTVTAPANQTNNEGDTITPVTIPQSQDANSFTITGLPSGLTYDATTGTISGTIGSYAAGTYTVGITATDTDNSTATNSASAQFTWTVNDTTAPSITQPSDQSNNEGVQITPLQIQAQDADSFSATGLPPGLSISSSGLITGTISQVDGDVPSYTVTVTATDTDNSTSNNSSKVQFNWAVADNLPPVLTTPNDQTNNEGDQNISLQIQAQDADSFSATGLPPGLSIDSKTGFITGTIGSQAANSSPYKVTVYAVDNGHQSSVSFNWNVVDTTPPTIAPVDNQSNNEGDQVTDFQIQATDADSFTATGLPSGLSINNSGVISGTIGSYAAGSYTVTVVASDNGYKSQPVNFTWTVADSSPPSFANLGPQVSNEGATVTLATNPVDADQGSIMALNLPTGLSINSTTGVISGTIDPHAAGTYDVSISATDGKNNLGGIKFEWTVNGATSPTLTNPGTQHSSNGQPISLAIQAANANAGTFKATGLPAGLNIDPTTGVISGTIFASPGTYNVTVSASGSSAASSVTFAWVVNQLTTSTVVTNIHNSYVGLFQVETVTAQVTDPVGIPLNSGDVTFLVNGESVVAPVVNGFATATIVTSMFSFDMTIFLNDFFTHALDAVYNSPAGSLGSSEVTVSETAMLLDYLLFLESTSLGSLVQQLTQLQS